MKLVTAVIRPEKLEAVRKVLEERGLQQLTVSQVVGRGHERGPSLIYRSNAFQERELARMKLEVVVSDTSVDAAVDAIRESASTGRVGDGIVVVTPVERFVRIRTGESTGWSSNGDMHSDADRELPANLRLRLAGHWSE